MSDKPTVNNNGIGFFGLLGVLFIGLKLTGYIDWSWFWVLSPLIFPFSLVALILLLGFIVAVVNK